MNLTPPIHSPHLNPRKRELLDYVETNLDAQENSNRFNASYRADDRKFMQFLIPPGKRILELGCGCGTLLEALQPAHGVGIDFSPRAIARARALYPDLHFVLGDVEDPATLDSVEGPFDYIVIADTIGMLEDIDGTQSWWISRKVASISSNIAMVSAITM